MNFASATFISFFLIFLLLHTLLRKRLAGRNLLVLVASYFFYGWWDWRFLGLLVFSTAVDYVAALRIQKARTLAVRRGWLGLSIASNLGLLGFFKYAGFFADSLAACMGWPPDCFTLNVILPVGISFYTFQTLGYTLDVYSCRVRAEQNPIVFAAYVAFFPQLVAGPIERAERLLPQFLVLRAINRDDICEGLWLLLRGYFKKVVIADQLAPVVDLAYGTSSGPLGLALGAFAFGLQIYGDFSGYSDIARGLARWLGFDLMVNFRQPYFATSLKEFWSRWHISLSTWLRDYLYIPLGGNRSGRARTIVNLLLTMTLGGLWHGAAWTFVVWGFWHGLALVVERFLGPRRMPTPLAWLATQGVVAAGWMLFRAGSLATLAEHLHGGYPVWLGAALQTFLLLGALGFLLDAQERAGRAPPVVQRVAMALAVLLFWELRATPFIYFQF